MDSETKNLIASLVSGTLFGASWWLMIHIGEVYPDVKYYKHSLLFVPGMLSSVSLIINKLIPNSTLSENTSLSPGIILCRIAFFVSMALGFGGIVFAIVATLVSDQTLPMYAIIGIPIHNGVILAANMIFKFVAVDEGLETF